MPSEEQVIPVNDLRLNELHALLVACENHPPDPVLDSALGRLRLAARNQTGKALEGAE